MPEAVESRALNKRLCDFFPPQQKVIAFFINQLAVSPDVWMRVLAEEAKLLGYGTVGLLTENSREAVLDSVDLLLTVAAKDIRYLERIDLFCVTDFERIAYPESSRVLSFAHACAYWSGRTDAPHAIENQLHFDGYAVSYPLENKRDVFEKLWTHFFPPQACKRPLTDFQILPIGYPRLDVLCRKLEKNPSPALDSIIYAPIGIEYALSMGGYRVQKYARSTIRCLLDAFPGMRVIFCPYAADSSHPHILELARHFANEPRFFLDFDRDHSAAFSRAAVLITDFSHIMNTFAFSTLRPAISFMPWSKERASHLKWSNYGFKATNFRGLVHAVSYVLANLQECREHLAGIREQGLNRPEYALTSLAASLGDFIAGKSRPEWLSIPRALGQTPDGDGRWSATRSLYAALCRADEAERLSLVLAIWRHCKNSPLLTAAALHLGKVYAPQDKDADTIANVARSMLSLPLHEAKHFGEIELELVLRLYDLAQTEARDAHDADQERLIAFLKNFARHPTATLHWSAKAGALSLNVQ